MGEREVVWVRHTWDLSDLRLDTEPPPGYDFRPATKSDRSSIICVVLDAYGSDPIWAPMMDGIRRRMTQRVEETLGRPDAAYIVATWSDIPIGVSGVAVSHWTDQQLLTGICVTRAHQRRGVGRCLLAESLRWLHAQGLLLAQVYTEHGSVADQIIYPLFGSNRLVGVVYPGAGPRPASTGGSL